MTEATLKDVNKLIIYRVLGHKEIPGSGQWKMQT